MRHEQQSLHGPLLVSERAGVRTLRFGARGDVQTALRPGKPLLLELHYTRAAMAAALAFVPQPRRAAFVGLGGGAMPAFLRAAFPEVVVDIVELDPAVAEAARNFFGLTEDARMRVHVGDGRSWLEASPGDYDLLFLDAYGRDAIPRHLVTRPFIELARQKLASGGAVVGNVWEWPNALYASMRRTYQEVFRELYVLPVPQRSNRILVGLDHGQRAPGAELSRRLVPLATRLELPFDLPALGELLTRHTDIVVEAPVLEDES